MTKLAVFFLDAIRYRDINSDNTPFLCSLAREGVSGPLETLLAYEGLAATLFSGKYPSHHGVWTRYYADPHRSPFRWIGPLAPLLDRMNASQDQASRRLIRYCIMRVSCALGRLSYFPGLDEVPYKQLVRMNFSIKRRLYERGAFGRILSLFDILREKRLSFQYVDHGLFDSDRRVFERALSIDPKDDVIVVRFLDLDTVSHRHGLQSPEMLDTLRQTDKFVEGIISKWRRICPELSVLCFADHGMVAVDHQIDLKMALERSGLRPFEDFEMFLDSTMGRFWGENGALDNIRKVLSKLDCGRILTEHDRQNYQIPDSHSWGQIIFLVNPGFAIFPNFFGTRSVPRAMHGYDPKFPGLETLFLLHSPKRVPTSSFRSKIKMVDVLPTILELLGLELPSYCQGTSLLGT